MTAGKGDGMVPLLKMPCSPSLLLALINAEDVGVLIEVSGRCNNRTKIEREHRVMNVGVSDGSKPSNQILEPACEHAN